MEEYYTAEEAAELLRVHKLTIYRWIQMGKLPAFKVGAQYRIRRKDLEQVLKPVR